MIRDDDELSARFFPPDRLITADVAVVLGANDPMRPAERAVALYRNGHARELLFSGGFNGRLGGTEAEEMAAVARAAGVPNDAILIEPQARHTDENLQFARAMISKSSAILLVTIQFHLCRALIAARKHFPDAVEIGWTCYPSLHYDSTNWSRSPRGRADVESEIRKIGLYYGAATDAVR